MYPVVRIVFDRRKTAAQNRAGAVELEIYFQKKRKWMSTGVRVLPRNWHPDKRVVGRVDSVDLNMRIGSLEGAVTLYIRKLMAENKPFSWAAFETAVRHGRQGDSFISFVESEVSERKDISEGTRKNHRKFLKALKEFGAVRDFNDLTKQNIMAYDRWLHGRKNYTQSTIASYHKFMKVYVNEAIRKEQTSVNPYDGIKVDRGKSAIRKFLTPDELGRIENANLDTPSLRKTRDVFIFQCHTGLAYADLCKFDFGKVILRNGRHVLHDTRHKTGEEFYIVLLPKALEVLQRYGGRLPLMSNQQYNMRLKIVADAAGVEKRLTSHMGRHTYATMCLNSGIKIEVLAKMMGHTDIKTTQIYARLVNSTIEDAYSVLELSDKLKRMCDTVSAILSYMS